MLVFVSIALLIISAIFGLFRENSKTPEKFSLNIVVSAALSVTIAITCVVMTIITNCNGKSEMRDEYDLEIVPFSVSEKSNNAYIGVNEKWNKKTYYFYGKDDKGVQYMYFSITDSANEPYIKSCEKDEKPHIECKLEYHTVYYKDTSWLWSINAFTHHYDSDDIKSQSPIYFGGDSEFIIHIPDKADSAIITLDKNEPQPTPIL